MIKGALELQRIAAPSGGHRPTPPLPFTSEPPSKGDGIASVPPGQEGIRRRRLNAGRQPLEMNGGPDRDKVGDKVGHQVYNSLLAFITAVNVALSCLQHTVIECHPLDYR